MAMEESQRTQGKAHDLSSRQLETSSKITLPSNEIMKSTDNVSMTFSRAL